VISENRIVVPVGNTKGASLVCFDKQTGKLLWQSGDDEAAYSSFMIATLAGFGLILNVLLWWMFIRPVSRISSLADRISLGDLEAPDLKVRSRDEIHTLAESWARLRKSLAQAMQMLET